MVFYIRKCPSWSMVGFANICNFSNAFAHIVSPYKMCKLLCVYVWDGERKVSFVVKRIIQFFFSHSFDYIWELVDNDVISSLKIGTHVRAHMDIGQIYFTKVHLKYHCRNMMHHRNFFMFFLSVYAFFVIKSMKTISKCFIEFSVELFFLIWIIIFSHSTEELNTKILNKVNVLDFYFAFRSIYLQRLFQSDLR